MCVCNSNYGFLTRSRHIRASPQSTTLNATTDQMRSGWFSGREQPLSALRCDLSYLTTRRHEWSSGAGEQRAARSVFCWLCRLYTLCSVSSLHSGETAPPLTGSKPARRHAALPLLCRKEKQGRRGADSQRQTRRKREKVMTGSKARKTMKEGNWVSYRKTERNTS